MDHKEMILDAMKSADEPLRARNVADLTGLDLKVVFKTFAELRESREITFVSHCMWEPIKK